MNNVLNYVFEHSKQSGSALLVLVAIADWATAEGFCPARIAAIAEKARLSERQTKRILHQLESQGEIKIHFGEGRQTSHGMTNSYQILMDGVSPATPPNVTGDTRDTPPMTPQGVTPETPQGVTSASPESLIDPDLDPLKKSQKESLLIFEEIAREGDFIEPTPAQHDLWSAVMAQLAGGQIDFPTFTALVRGAALLATSEGRWRIGVKSEQARKMCTHSNLYDTIHRVVNDCAGSSDRIALEFVVMGVQGVRNGKL